MMENGEGERERGALYVFADQTVFSEWSLYIVLITIFNCYSIVLFKTQ